MRRLWSTMNPTLRGFLLIAIVAALIVVLSLEATVISLFLLARIAFFLAIALVLYLLWRDRLRGEIETWSRRSQSVFYGATALIVIDLGVFFWRGAAGLDAIAFLAVLALSGFAMWRVWRDERSYGY